MQEVSRTVGAAGGKGGVFFVFFLPLKQGFIREHYSDDERDAAA